MALSTAQLSGGPHDGERITHPPAAPLHERLFAISFDDGAQYARTGEQVDVTSGETVLLLRYDPDGSLTRAAQVAFG
jgi:hypothetical protein